MAKKQVEKVPITDVNQPLISSGTGVLCFDKYSGRYFCSDQERIRRVCNDLSRELLSDMTMPLNSFYEAIGLDDIPIGDELGWDVDHGLIEPWFSSQITSQGIPCLVIDFETSPKLLRN